MLTVLSVNDKCPACGGSGFLRQEYRRDDGKTIVSRSLCACVEAVGVALSQMRHRELQPGVILDDEEGAG